MAQFPNKRTCKFISKDLWKNQNTGLSYMHWRTTSSWLDSKLPRVLSDSSDCYPTVEPPSPIVWEMYSMPTHQKLHGFWCSGICFKDDCKPTYWNKFQLKTITLYSDGSKVEPLTETKHHLQPLCTNIRIRNFSFLVVGTGNNKGILIVCLICFVQSDK